MQCEPIISNEFVAKVKPLIDKSKKSIGVCVFDWRWYPQDIGCQCQIFNQAIIQAKNRGVEIKAVVNQEGIYKILKSLNINVKQEKSSQLLHSKIMIIDENIVITGSHNYSQSAFTANTELSVILSEDENIKMYLEFFNNLFNK